MTLAVRAATPDDAAAIAFYEALGGRKIGAYTDAGPMWRSDNLLYIWDDLRRLTDLRQSPAS